MLGMVSVLCLIHGASCGCHASRSTSHNGGPSFLEECYFTLSLDVITKGARQVVTANVTFLRYS